jgi:hypothetical protein
LHALAELGEVAGGWGFEALGVLGGGMAALVLAGEGDGCGGRS